MAIINSVVFGSGGGGGPAVENQGDVVNRTEYLIDFTSSSSISKIVIDGNYLYVAAGSSLSKIRKSDLIIEGFLNGLNGDLDGVSSIRDFVIVGNHIFAVGSSGTVGKRNIKKIDKTTFSFISSSAEDYSSSINSIVSDGTYLYIGGTTTNQVWKYDAASLIRVAVGQTYGTNISHIILYGSNVLVKGSSGTLTNAYWTRYDTATLTQQQVYTFATNVTTDYYDRPFIIGDNLYHKGSVSSLLNPASLYKLDLITPAITSYFHGSSGVPAAYSIAQLSSTQILGVGTGITSTDFATSKMPYIYNVFDLDFTSLSSIKPANSYKTVSNVGLAVPYNFTFDNDYIYLLSNGQVHKIKR